MNNNEVFSFFEPLTDHNVIEEERVAGLEALLTDVNFSGKAVIKEVFDKFSTMLVIDKKWTTDLKKYVYSFVTRRTAFVDHMEFFGSPYVGLQKITFTTADRNEWFSTVFDTDEEELKQNLHAIKAIDSSWNVVGDVFNLSVPYLMNRVYNSNLDPKTKHEALIDIVSMYHYKCLTSLINNDYKFLARKEVALETYNRLSLKYDIKKYGSWHRLIEARAEHLLNPKTSIHYQAFSKMDDDKKVIYMVGDIQNRLRRVMNEINKVFHDVKNKTNIVSLGSARVNLGDELTLKNVAKEVTGYINYLERILTEGGSFYKDELIDHVSGVLSSVPKDKLTNVITNLPQYYNNPRKPKYKEFVETVILHMNEYMHTHGIKKTNVYDVLIKMRGALGAPLSNNDLIKIIRKDGDDIVKEITGIKTQQSVQLIRTGLCLYIILRVLSKDFYEWSKEIKIKRYWFQQDYH